MKVIVVRLLCLLLPIQVSQLLPVGYLNWQNILKWYFLKYYQVHKRRVFPEPVTYVLHNYHNSLDYISTSYYIQHNYNTIYIQLCSYNMSYCGYNYVDTYIHTYVPE